MSHSDFGVVADSYKDFVEWCRMTGHDPTYLHYLSDNDHIRGCRYRYIIVTRRAQESSRFKDLHLFIDTATTSVRLSYL